MQGSAVKAGYMAMKHLGGKLMLFAATLPTVGEVLDLDLFSSISNITVPFPCCFPLFFPVGVEAQPGQPAVSEYG